MVSAEAPVLFAKACEIFITELTNRAWMFTEESKRRTLSKVDIAACIQQTEIFDFLIDIQPKKDQITTSHKQKRSKQRVQEVLPTVNQLGLGQQPDAPQQELSVNSNQQQQFQGQQLVFSDRFLQNTSAPPLLQAENTPCMQQVQILQGSSSLRQYQLPQMQNSEQQQTHQQLKFSQQLQSQQPQQKQIQQQYSPNNNFNFGIKEGKILKDHSNIFF